MNEDYTWVPWFETLVKKIADGGEEYLSERAKKVDWERNTPPLLKFGDKNIDPFSFLYYLAQCNGRNARETIYKSVDDVFGIGRKELLSGDTFTSSGFIIPTPTFVTPALFHYKGVGNPVLIWKLFRQAVKGSDHINAENFSDTLKIKMVGVPKLTQCLFLTNSKEFMPVDNGIFKFHATLNLPESNEAKRRIAQPDGWIEYQAILGKFKTSFPNRPFYEINTDLYMKSINEPGQVYVDKKPNNTNTQNSDGMTLNKIFYGPPGTGKTYHTINAALEILDPDFYKENSQDRDQLLDRYEQLKKEGQIAFVTFHQSFGYEEFVEGIRPVMGEGENEQIAYEIKDGVFKEICGRATSSKTLRPLELAIEKLKEKFPEEEPFEMETVVRKKKHEVFYREENNSFITKPKEGHSEDGSSVPVSMKMLRKYYENPGMKKGTRPGMILNYLKLGDTQPKSEHKNYVLIIDEINRGNISRIFGELITLIEKTKRLGKDEATTATLPYSGESFGVPNNLYIIGTMNTADRSIALLDTALRRRFRFEEMMPNYELLEGIDVAEINIAELLRTMNERIEALHDRDHQIGHSYFIDLEKTQDIKTLKDIFRYEILPLLQEYFYDDWAKIDVILNKNSFLKSKKLSGKIKNQDFIDPDKKLWYINESAFDDIQNYLKIYEDSGDAETDSSS